MGHTGSLPPPDKSAHPADEPAAGAHRPSGGGGAGAAAAVSAAATVDRAAVKRLVAKTAAHPRCRHCAVYIGTGVLFTCVYPCVSVCVYACMRIPVSLLFS